MPLSSAYQQQFEEQQERAENAPAQPVQSEQQEFDYKTSPVNQRGESLPAGAKQWTPTGQPYFGEGLGGTLKKYAWMFMGSPTGQDDSRWEKFQEMAQTPQFWSDPTSKEFKEGISQFGAGVMGEKDPEANARFQQIQAEYRTPNGVNISAMPDEVRREFEDLQKTYGGGSILSPVVKGTKVAVQAAMDVLSEAAIKFEQAQGVTSAMRDYAQENSTLPALASDIDRTQGSPADQAGFWSDPMVAIKSESAQEVGNITSRLLMPVLNSWDAFRFITAPGTLKQKQAAIEQGWDAGRILYSQAIKPSLLEEFKRRAQAGEDPQLLAMELQNPWAEAIGQSILDPLNVVGMIGKGAKAAGMLDKATEAVRGGSFGDEAADLLRGTDNLGETRAAAQMDQFDEILTKNVDRIESQRLTVDFNKATSYSPSGLRVRETKTVQTVSNVVTSSIMRNGGSADDVIDFFADISKAVSADKAVRLEAWDRIMTMSNRFGMGRYAFSDDVLETGVLLRNLVDDKDLLPAIQAGKGDLAKTAEILNRKFKAAIEKQVPTYSQVKKLAEDFRTGANATKQAEKAAKTYAGITGRNKALWNLHEGTLGTFKQKVNSVLGKFYFSQPGFVSRNASNNLSTMLVDQGFSGTAKSFYRDGKYWSIADIEDDLMKWNGGKLPPAASGITSLSQAEDASTGITKLNESVEAGFAKRIYWKQFRDTMDKFMTPGVALPARGEFKAAGMTDEGIDRFVHILKHKAYGNVDEAITEYTKEFGDSGLLDVWKRWNDSVSPDEMKGLSEVGITKEIEEIVSTAATRQEVKERITKLKRELTNRANSAADNPVGVNRERAGFEFIEDVNKATDQGLLDVDGTNKLNILIETSERASDELMAAIGKARDTATDPALREQFKVMEAVFSSDRRGAVRETTSQLWKTAYELKAKAKKSTGLQVEQLWNQSILAKRGPAPAGINTQQFLDELFPATRDMTSNTWEMYFAEGFDKLTPLIDNLTEQFPDLAPIFAKAQKSSAELNVYRTAIYRDGKIFYQQPAKNVRELASRYGIATATPDGRPNDRQLLATINKYADQKYKSIDEVPLEEAERALEARRAGAQTTADAARVEAPKAGGKGAPAPASGAQMAQPVGGQFTYEQVYGKGVVVQNPSLDTVGKLTPVGFSGYVGKGQLQLVDGTIIPWASSSIGGEMFDDAGNLIDNKVVAAFKNPSGEWIPTEFYKGQTPKTPPAQPKQTQNLTEKAIESPRSELPEEVSQRLADEARRLQSELFGGEAGKRTAQGVTGTTNVSWYRDLYQKGMRKPQIDKALDKIIMDAGADVGASVERVKDMIMDTLRYGDKTNGIPPDLKALQALGADDKTLAAALDDYNDITKQELTLEQALGAQTEGAAQLADEGAELVDTSRPYYDDEGNLVNPTDELGEIRDPSPSPEVQIQPPYVDGSTPIPGQMWKENSDGIMAALNKVERYMLDNWGIQAAERMDGGRIKAIKSLMKESRGRITEGLAIADKIGKEWRDFALLPYGETKNFDLALSYAFPYQFWYSRSYANWMKRVATDPAVIANYARIKESMSRINKDSPEWWRYNVEVPAHFLGLPNEHPMSFNLEANIWPLYGLTGTDFNDPIKRQNWLTSTIDDMGKLGPSTWAPMQWAMALYYRAKGEDELAQAYGGRIIPQTATVKAISSYFGQPLELDPGVQMFSGDGIMDFAAMDKYERNRVGRALTAMVQSGEITEEQAVEVARTQEGPAWDDAVRRATQIRAPGQISSYFLGVGMKARTEEDRITDEFYEKYYRLQNLNEADLISPDQYQKDWDALRNEYPFMDALLLSRKAGPDRDRAYAYNVLGRIPPGQASDIYKLVGIDSKTAQQFYDSKGNIKDWPDSERDKFMASMVDLGAMLALPDYATKQDWNDARAAYKDVQEGMRRQFGADIQDKIDQFFSLADQDDRDRFMEKNPTVQAALSWQNEQVIADEALYEYYGGIGALERFHKGKVYDELEKTYGADIQDKWDTYYDMQITDPAGAKTYYRQHPELKAYNRDKTALMEQALRSIVEFGSRLPDNPRPELTGNEPESVGQQNIVDYATQSAPGFDFWQQEMPEVTAILANYWTEGEEIPYAVEKNLDYLAEDYGYQDGEALLQAILISMNR